jgi:hypothetical protein
MIIGDVTLSRVPPSLPFPHFSLLTDGRTEARPLSWLAVVVSGCFLCSLSKFGFGIMV